jgi:hypothetical protein
MSLRASAEVGDVVSAGIGSEQAPSGAGGRPAAYVPRNDGAPLAADGGERGGILRTHLSPDVWPFKPCEPPTEDPRRRLGGFTGGRRIKRR